MFSATFLLLFLSTVFFPNEFVDYIVRSLHDTPAQKHFPRFFHHFVSNPAIFVTLVFPHSDWFCIVVFIFLHLSWRFSVHVHTITENIEYFSSEFYYYSWYFFSSFQLGTPNRRIPTDNEAIQFLITLTIKQPHLALIMSVVVLLFFRC